LFVLVVVVVDLALQAETRLLVQLSVKQAVDKAGKTIVAPAVL
jgi:hypothetical protein